MSLLESSRTISVGTLKKTNGHNGHANVNGHGNAGLTPGLDKIWIGEPTPGLPEEVRYRLVKRAAGLTPAAKMSFHPLADQFPKLPAEELRRMAEQIIAAGGSQPLLKTGDVIIDDVNRARAWQLACGMTGIAVVFREWDRSGTIAEVIGRANIPRSLLTESQRAAVAVPIAESIRQDTISKRNSSLRQGNPGPRQQSAKTAIPAKASVPLNLGERRTSRNTSPQGDQAGAGETQEKAASEAAGKAAEICRVSKSYVEFAQAIYKADRDIFERLRTDQTFNINQARLQLSKKNNLQKINSSPLASLRLGGSTSTSDLIIHGDCIKEMAKIRDGKFTIIFADPPYNNGWKYDSDPTGDHLPDEKYLDWCEDWFKECTRLLASNGSLFVLIDDRYSDLFGHRLRNTRGLHRRNTIIWWEKFANHTSSNFTREARYLHYYTRSEKNFIWNPDRIKVEGTRDVIKDGRKTEWGKVPGNIWEISRIAGTFGERVPFDEAPPQIPGELIRRCILAASNEGDHVLDPFAGNGTTGVEALKLGRKFTGIERSKKYAEQARQWIASQVEKK